MKRLWIASGMLVLFAFQVLLPCTIISAKTKKNVVWAGNNEDFVFDFNTYLNVFPREGGLWGAVFFTYGSPDSTIQGGFNEAGLFFDYNSLPAIPKSDWKDWGKRKTFPKGERGLDEHNLRRCSTVQDVIRVLKEFEMDLSSAQMHVADRNGNLAVISQSGVRMSKNPYQITTNFNIFTRGPSDKEAPCWRYPIAESIFREREISQETMKDVLAATQQPYFSSTNYSNVINLTTGDAYNYYAGDFKNAFHFNIKELLTKGKKSYLWRSLFPNAPVVKIWEMYLKEGPAAAVELFRKIEEGIPAERKPEILRHVFLSCLLRENKHADARVIFDEWSRVNGGKDALTNFYQGLIHLTNGDVLQAENRFREQLKTDAAPTDAMASSMVMVKRFLDKLVGEKTPSANVHLELKGHAQARFVCVAGISKLPIANFLIKTEAGWEADFALPPGRQHYVFLVDGKTVFDPQNPEIEEIDTEFGKMTFNVIDVK